MDLRTDFWQTVYGYRVVLMSLVLNGLFFAIRHWNVISPQFDGSIISS